MQVQRLSRASFCSSLFSSSFCVCWQNPRQKFQLSFLSFFFFCAERVWCCPLRTVEWTTYGRRDGRTEGASWQCQFSELIFFLVTILPRWYIDLVIKVKSLWKLKVKAIAAASLGSNITEIGYRRFLGIKVACWLPFEDDTMTSINWFWLIL